MNLFNIKGLTIKSVLFLMVWMKCNVDRPPAQKLRLCLWHGSQSFCVAPICMESVKPEKRIFHYLITI